MVRAIHRHKDKHSPSHPLLRYPHPSPKVGRYNKYCRGKIYIPYANNNSKQWQLSVRIFPISVPGCLWKTTKFEKIWDEIFGKFWINRKVCISFGQKQENRLWGEISLFVFFSQSSYWPQWVFKPSPKTGLLDCIIRNILSVQSFAEDNSIFHVQCIACLHEQKFGKRGCPTPLKPISRTV